MKGEENRQIQANLWDLYSHSPPGSMDPKKWSIVMFILDNVQKKNQ